jgi:hypothetical protein
VIGDLGLNLPEAARQSLLGHAGLRRLEAATALEPVTWPDGPQAITAGRDDLALHVQRVDGGAALHLIRYAYDEVLGRVPDLPVLDLAVRLPGAFTRATVYAPGREPVRVEVKLVGQTHHVHLENVPLYCIVEFGQ